MADDLTARVQRLEDLLSIHQLFIDYGLALDAGDFDAYAALFAADGEVLLGPMGRAKGRDEIKALMTKTLSGGVGSSFHIISSPQVQLDGDTATSQVMWSVVSRDESGNAAAQDDRTPPGQPCARRRSMEDRSTARVRRPPDGHAAGAFGSLTSQHSQPHLG